MKYIIGLFNSLAQDSNRNAWFLDHLINVSSKLLKQHYKLTLLSIYAFIVISKYCSTEALLMLEIIMSIMLPFILHVYRLTILFKFQKLVRCLYFFYYT